MPVLRLVWRDGRVRTVEADGETVLAAAERAGERLPFGCRTGACATCTGRLLAGHVTHEREPRALKSQYREDGYVLPCIAVPTDDCTVEVGPELHRDLLANPWKRG